ncbi:hypothetical protein FisN_1Lh223 [Fistulifera solaris]|uniref:SET domain-containing protein n=1 Tax=Fistulifera solaris TaxID=1519565 RepID=A0A1Z5K4U6_FISSO|nr:hypothetical protein FisN_1Lh223 [Fistulifera solaris]|eukprot:GAX21101.1 hypothetical protein FisN_1Lh223 [Fistulifera solaris]
MMAALPVMKLLLIMRVLALTSAYYSTTSFHRHVGVSAFLQSFVQDDSSIQEKYFTEAHVFEQLCNEVGVQPTGLLRLGESEDGIRGLYLNRAVKTGDLVLSIPLNKCFRDDQQLPDWMPRKEDESVEKDGAWALRLAACLMEAQKSPYQSHHSLWFSLLPNPSDLRSSLPIHWDDEVIQSTSHTAFTMAVDSAYFARVGAIQSIGVDVDLNGALDVIQTRTCRVQTSKGDPLRLLAPVFDLFNHASPATAEFSIENDDLLAVRAMADLDQHQHVCIDYGSSTTPAWNSLVSYGFIPAEDEELAEVYLDGVRYEVGPDFVPEDMVVAASSVYLAQTQALDNNVVLTPEIAMLLARRISDVAHSYSLPPGTKTIESTPESTISIRLASALRWNQHRILLKCSSNLQDWAEQQSFIE